MTEQFSCSGPRVAESEEVSSPEGNGNMFGVTVIEIITHLASHKRLIEIMTGAAILVGLLLSVVLPNSYIAVTKIMPPKQTQSTTSFLNSQFGMGSLGEAAGAGLSLKDPNAIYIGLLQSRPIADAIINKFNLVRVYHVKDMTAARKKLKDNTRIVSETSTLISISITDRDKKRVSDLANAYTEQLRTLTKTLSVSEATMRRIFFEGQLNDQKKALISAEVAFQQLQQNKGLVHLDTQANVIIGSLAGLHAQIAAKEVELEALRSYSTEHNSEVQLAERELSAMQQEEASQMEKHSRPTGYSDMGLKDIPNAGLDYVRAERELEFQKTLFDLLLRQYEAAKLDEVKEAATIQVVEAAIEPDRRSSPDRLLIPVYFAIGGFLVSCFIVWIMRWRDVAQTDRALAKAILNLKYALKVSNSHRSLKPSS